PPSPPRFPYTTLFRSRAHTQEVDRGRDHAVPADVAKVVVAFRGRATTRDGRLDRVIGRVHAGRVARIGREQRRVIAEVLVERVGDRKSTRLNSSHVKI